MQNIYRLHVQDRQTTELQKTATPEDQHLRNQRTLKSSLIS